MKDSGCSNVEIQAALGRKWFMKNSVKF